MSEKSVQARIPELDGLRGMAIFLVVAGHYAFTIQGSSIGHLLHTSLNLYWTGVDLFFVLSGFLIGGILMDHRESPSYFRTFYTRRFFRIVPVYYIWICAYILLVTFGGAFLRAHMNTGTIQPVDREILSHFLFLQNFDVPSSTLSFPWLGPMWSLAVEEQFYLVAPLVIFLVPQRSLPWLLGTAICCAPLLRIIVRMGFLPFLGAPGLAAAFLAMPCRADALALGMMAAFLWRNPRARSWFSSKTSKLYAAFGVLLAGMAILWKWFPKSLSSGEESFGFTWIALFYTVALLLSLLSSSGPIARVARMAWLRELGKLSYCMYIIHVAVDFLCFKIGHTTVGVSFPHDLAITLLAAAITYTIAKLSWVFFEQPLLRLGHRFTYAPAPASPALSPAAESV
ncbi:MAG TPA: acyltransferase [Candidatus Acidoferrales bacterium]|jgi:peptidoglycan/LPS O-acetylase OafA/YrhL|nr:acyltransferase [Candidatus Acidoferrales bacterium]